MSNLVMIPRRHLPSEVTRQPFSPSSGENVATVAMTSPPANMIVVSQDDFILVGGDGRSATPRKQFRFMENINHVKSSFSVEKSSSYSKS